MTMKDILYKADPKRLGEKIMPPRLESFAYPPLLALEASIPVLPSFFARNLIEFPHGADLMYLSYATSISGALVIYGRAMYGMVLGMRREMLRMKESYRKEPY